MTKVKRAIGLLLAFLLVIASVPNQNFLAVHASETASTYYIDQDGGNDANTGLSPADAWASLDKVNSTTFAPGDTILFQRGDVWTGLLWPKGSGSEDAPITIGAYGESTSRPLIQGNSWCGENGDDLENLVFNTAVFFYNQQYWEITSLEITNRIAGDTSEDHIKKYGILIMGKDAGTLRHMYCRDLYVHDVISTPVGQEAGIGRGGIIYIIRGNTVETCWDDIVVESNQVGPNVNHYGINFLSTWGSSSFPSESGIPSSEMAGSRVNSTNIVIRNNYCVDIGNAAICPSAYRNALIEYNVCDGCNSGPNGNVPIWWENGDYTVAQYNEVFGSGASSSKEDSQAFDADCNTKLNYIQYNYTHDNPSGAYFECALGSTYTTYIRYNISQNDGYGTNSHGGGSILTLGGSSSGTSNKMYVYNNFFYLEDGYDSYITNNWDGVVLNPSNYVFTNNIIFSNAESKGWSECFWGTADHNAYGGTDTGILRSDDLNAVSVSNSDFAAIGTGEEGIDSVAGYKLSQTSVCIDAGSPVTNNGGLDYWSGSVDPFSAPNIGPDNGYNTGSTGLDILDFEDRPSADSALSGTYETLGFGDGWMTGGENNDKYLWMNSSDGTATITLPEGKTISHLAFSCDTIAYVTISNGITTKSFSISPSKNLYSTDFAYTSENVTISIDAADLSSVKIDNIHLVDAPVKRTNIALDKAVTTSGDNEHPAANGNDGDTSTLWVHNGPDVGVWWQVDLGQEYSLDEFAIVFEHDTGDNAWQYYIQGSSNGSDFTTIFDRSNNTDSSQTQTGSFADGTCCRYVRVVISDVPSSDYWCAFAEFELYAVETTAYENVALGKTATQSGGSGSASYGNDGDTATWAGNTGSFPYWWQVDLGNSYTISLIEVEWEDLPDIAEDWKYKIEYSNDSGATWTTVVDYTNESPFTDAAASVVQAIPTQVTCNALRITITVPPTNRTTAWAIIPEFRAYSQG